MNERVSDVLRAPVGTSGRGVLRAAWVGAFFVWTAGIHVGIVAADTSFYRHFADGALVPGVQEVWRTVFLADPVAWGLATAAGEAALGLLLLFGSRGARLLGWSGVIGFHVALMVFGWGFWVWSLPALALLVPAALQDVAPFTPSRGRAR
jgi:hypothetical protein